MHSNRDDYLVLFGFSGSGKYAGNMGDDHEMYGGFKAITQTRGPKDSVD